MVEKHVFGPLRHRASPQFRRADLEFYGINHFRPSYVARIYFNDPDVGPDDATDQRESYAGSFAIFGHPRCTGTWITARCPSPPAGSTIVLPIR